MNRETVRRLLLALPDVSEQPHFQAASFRVKGAILATLPPKGGELRVFLKDDGLRDQWLQREPEALRPQYWGARRVGLTVDLTLAQPGWLAELLRQTRAERR